jgi:hypothetical protein
MASLKDSGNLVIGLENNTIDLFDNPYVRIAAYKINETYELKEEIKTRKCTEADLLSMMPKEVTSFYPNSICLDERPSIEGNWFEKHFKNIFFAIEECSTTT